MANAMDLNVTMATTSMNTISAVVRIIYLIS